MKELGINEVISSLSFYLKYMEGIPMSAIGVEETFDFDMDSVELGRLKIFTDMIMKYAIKPGDEWADGQPNIDIAFTPTGLGTIKVVRYNNIKLNITNFDIW